MRAAFFEHRLIASRRARAWLLSLTLLSACKPTAPRCHFGAEHPVFTSSATNFDDVALVWFGTHAAVFFSEQSGLYTRWLDGRGVPAALAQRLGPRCDAGVTAAISGKATRLVCARRSGDQPASRGGVWLYALDEQLRVEHVERIGPVGPNSHGVALVVDERGLTIAWQDAALDSARIWLSHGTDADPIVISDGAFAASAPGLVSQATRLYATWAESREVGRRLESRVQLAELSADADAVRPITVAQSRDASPSPDLVASDAELWLSYRDRRLAARRTGLYLERLDRSGRSLGAPVRAARADGVGRPVLRRCLGGVLAATPRTFAGDYFVGIVRADPTLQTLSGEQQFYEDSHEFAQVASTCAGDHALFLMAERGRLGRGRAALRSVTFACD